MLKIPSRNQISNAFAEAKRMLNGNTANNTKDAKKILKKIGIDEGFINKAIKVAVPMAKAAKFAGVKELQNVDIDDIAKKAKSIADEKDYGVATPNYQQPKKQTYVPITKEKGKASNLPD